MSTVTFYFNTLRPSGFVISSEQKTSVATRPETILHDTLGEQGLSQTNERALSEQEYFIQQCTDRTAIAFTTHNVFEVVLA